MKKYSKSQLENLIDEWVIGRNSKRNKKIIRDNMIVGLGMKEIAEKNKMSETRVKTVIRTFRRTVEEQEENGL